MRGAHETEGYGWVGWPLGSGSRALRVSGMTPVGWFRVVPGPSRDYFVVDAGVRRTGHRGKLWETRLLGDEVRKNQPYFVNI